MEHQKDMTEIAKELVAALHENQQFYRTAANNAASDELRQLLHERAEQRDEFARELAMYSSQAAVEEDEEGGDFMEFLHRGLVTIKAAMTIERSKTDDIIIQESLDADKQLLDEFDNFLTGTSDLPSGIKNTIYNQYAAIKTGHTYVGTTLYASHPVVLGLFANLNDAEQLIEQLSANGLSRENIHVVAQEDIVSQAVDDNRATMAKESATTGALSGSVFGGILGVIMGATMVLTMGPVLILGIPALAGTTAFGTIVGAFYGSLFGALLGWGVAEDEVQAYIKGLREGQILVVANVEPERVEEITALFKQHHGDIVSVRQSSGKDSISKLTAS